MWWTARQRCERAPGLTQRPNACVLIPPCSPLLLSLLLACAGDLDHYCAAGGGAGSGLPSMLMYFHERIEETVLWRTWIPRTDGERSVPLRRVSCTCACHWLLMADGVACRAHAEACRWAGAVAQHQYSQSTAHAHAACSCLAGRAC